MKILRIIIVILLIVNLFFLGKLFLNSFLYTGIYIRCGIANEIIAETPYLLSKKNGVETEYHSNGAIKRKTYYNFDKKDGLEREYYFYEDIKRETPYKKGLKNGTERIYYENGFLQSETDYVDDEIISERQYNENGRLIEKSTINL